MAGGGSRALHPPSDHQHLMDNSKRHRETPAKQRPKPTARRRGQNIDDTSQSRSVETEDPDAPASRLGSRPTLTYDLPPPEQTPPIQEARQHNTPAFSTAGRTPIHGHPTPTPLSPPNPSGQPTVFPHPNPLRDVRMGERQPIRQPPSQIAAARQPLVSTPGPTTDISWQPPASPYPAIGCDERPVSSSRSPPHQQVFRAQSQLTLPPSNSNGEVQPSDVSSIPKPAGLSGMNLRAAMQLDGSPRATKYYNKIRFVVRGHMSECHWMDWSNLSDGQKNMLFNKVHTDPRIPIIKRYENHWATEAVAKTIASNRRQSAYACGDATRPQKYAYNATNSAKRNPEAPRGRWNSVSQSVERGYGKGENVRHTKGDISTVLPEALDRGNMNALITDTRSLSHTTPDRPQDTSSNEIMDASTSIAPRLNVNNETQHMYHFQLPPPTLNDNAVAGPSRIVQYQPQRDHLGGEPFTSSGGQHQPRFPSYPITDDATPIPTSQTTQDQPQHFPSFMDRLYSFDAPDEQPKEETDSHGSQN